MNRAELMPVKVEVPILGTLEVRSMRVTKQFQFDAAHQLLDRPETVCGQSKHGHRYVLDIEVCGALDEHQMVVDFLDLKPLIEEHLIRPYLDHHDLNETVHEVYPTAEYLVRFIVEHLDELLPTTLGVMLSRLRIYETPSGWVDCELISSSDVAYIAGLFDGEGSVSQSGGAELQLRISNTDRGVLEWTQSVIGGSIQSTAKVCNELVLAVGRARAVASLLLPYSRLEQKRKVLAILAHFPRRLESQRYRPYTDVQVQEIVDHLNAVSMVNHPEKPPPHTVETWRIHSPAGKRRATRDWMKSHPEEVEEILRKVRGDDDDAEQC